VLFRGFEMMHTDVVDTEVPFTELFGRQDDEGHYCVDPQHNTFFYPAPFMVDVVNRYSIHAIYLTNYDVELVLMVRPSLHTRNARGSVSSSPYSHCTDGTLNKCGKRMIHHDPCLTPLLIKEFPNIHGYIAIAANDASRFKHGIFKVMYEDNIESAKSIAPFVVENALGLQSVPEIVLYPYHVRISDEVRRVHPRAVDMNPIHYGIKHRAELNYFPLLYITEKKIYTWNDLASYKTRKEMGETVRDNLEYISSIHEKEKFIVNHALSPGGISIYGVVYKFSIDVRTGFYVASSYVSNTMVDKPELTNVIQLYRNSYSEPYAPEPKYVVPFSYPYKVKKDIHGFLRGATKKAKSEEEFVIALNRIGTSFSKHYQFDITNPHKYKMNYKLETMFPRNELRVSKQKRYTRKVKHDKTI
jgi:hypothetical protein